MGAHFLVYDSSKNPIGEYVSDDRGYVYVRDSPAGATMSGSWTTKATWWMMS